MLSCFRDLTKESHYTRREQGSVWEENERLCFCKKDIINQRVSKKEGQPVYFIRWGRDRYLEDKRQQKSKRLTLRVFLYFDCKFRKISPLRFLTNRF